MFSDDVKKDEERGDESSNSQFSEDFADNDGDEDAYELQQEKFPPQARRGSDGLAQKPLRQSTADEGGNDQSVTPSVQQNLPRPLATKGHNADPNPTPTNQGSPRRQVNERFRDVRASGQWGKISRTEMIIGAVIVIMVIAGAVTAVLLVTASKPTPPNTQVTPLPTSAPSVQPEEDPAFQLLAILEAMEAVNISTTFFPSDATFFTPDLITNTSRLADFRAMSWVLNEDPRDTPPDNPMLVFRFALAAIYFAFDGENWIESENWLTGEHACKWHGIECEPAQENFIYEIDLSQNNAKGTIPIQLSLLSDLRSLVLSSNNLSGTIPSVRLGNMRDLSLLYLNDNAFIGELSELSSLNANNALRKCESVSHDRVVVQMTDSISYSLFRQTR